MNKELECITYELTFVYERNEDLYEVLAKTKNIDEQFLKVVLEMLSKEKNIDCLAFLSKIGKNKNKDQSKFKMISSILKNISEIDFNKQNYSSENNQQIKKDLIKKISYGQNIIEFLKFLVQLTSIDERLIQCGSKALNVLVEMKVDLREQCFENIRIRDTSLVGGNFQFDNVDISGMNLSQAQLFNCKWKNIKIHELNKLDGHSNRVNTVCFSPDGTILASGGGNSQLELVVFGNQDYFIRLWDVRTGKQKAKLDGHSNSVTSVNFSPDGTKLASGSSDNSIRLWDVKTGQQKAKLDGHSSAVWSVNFSPDGTTLASGSEDKSICLWDVKTSKEILLSDKGYKDPLAQFNIPLHNSSLLLNVNPYCTILRICQNPFLEASGTLILKGQFINHQGNDLKPLLKSKGSCSLEDLIQE